MKRPRFLLSLVTSDNEFQREQAAAAHQAAKPFDAEVQVIYSDSDAIQQSEQLLTIIQEPNSRPDGIIVQPAGGTSLPQVARAAAACGMGWVILNREAEYIAEIRATYKVPVCSVSSDQTAIGRIQGRQVAALLPEGGLALYIQGPTANPAVRQRTVGMSETKPASVLTKVIKTANWTSDAGYRAMSSWLRLSTSHDESVDLIVAQGEALVLGARKALQEQAGAEWEKWSHVPLLGVDGLPQGGQRWVRDGLLAATVVVPPNAGVALEILIKAIQTGIQPPENTLIAPLSYPPIASLLAMKSAIKAG
jgi:ABC-type sugar transport system substrate-binding protein